MEHSLSIGADISKGWIDIWSANKHIRIDNTQHAILKFLRKLPAGIVVAMEATNDSYLSQIAISGAAELPRSERLGQHPRIHGVEEGGRFGIAPQVPYLRLKNPSKTASADLSWTAVRRDRLGQVRRLAT